MRRGLAYPGPGPRSVSFGADHLAQEQGERNETDTLARRVGGGRNRCARAGHRVRGQHPVPDRIQEVQVQGEERGGEIRWKDRLAEGPLCRGPQGAALPKEGGNTDTTNLYSDPSFENGLHPFDNTAYATESWSTAQAYSGTHSMNLGGARYPRDSSAYWFPVTPGKAYSASTYFYNTTNTPGTFRVGFNWLDASGAAIGSSDGGGFGVPRNVWTKVYLDNAVAPARATQAQLKWEAIQAAGVFMDEVQVREGRSSRSSALAPTARASSRSASADRRSTASTTPRSRRRRWSSDNKKTCRGRKSGSVKISG